MLGLITDLKTEVTRSVIPLNCVTLSIGRYENMRAEFQSVIFQGDILRADR
jgi:hypothetical protein